MKNLFTHEILSENDEIYVPFENPYLAARVSKETEAMMYRVPEDKSLPQSDGEETQKLRTKEKHYLLMALLGFVFMFGSFLFLNYAGLLDYPFYLLPLGGMILSFIYIYKLKGLEQKKNGIPDDGADKVDFEALAQRMEEASKAARAEMDIPENDVSVEILPFGYKKKGGKIIPDRKAGRFDNTPMSMHVKEEKLCVFDGVARYEIPLTDIRGCHAYDKDYRIEFWLKEEEPSSEAYKEFKLKKAGFFEYKTHTYYGVEVVSEATGETFEMLVPGYDLKELRKVIDVEITL